MGLCFDGEIRSGKGRLQVGINCAVSFTVFLCYLIPSHPVLSSAVEIVVEGQTRLCASLNKHVRDRGDRRYARNVQRPTDTVEVVSSAFLVLGLLEIGQHFGVTPARCAQLCPMIIIPTMPTNVDHRVD